VGHVIATRGWLESSGAPAYYARFGFVRATDLGIEPPDPAWGEHFQGRHLTGPRVSGRFRYAEPFDRV
jgi:putative acetyltransferase